MKGVSLKNPKILELGSGSGTNSAAIAEILGAKELTLVDFNKTALEISKMVFNGSDLRVKYLNKNIIELNLKEKFDIAHSEGLIEHFYGKDRVAAFAKHVELCKQGGLIIIFVPYNSIQYSLFKRYHKMMKKWIWDERHLSRQELQSLCARFNLEILNEYNSPLIHEIGILARNSN